MEPQKKRFVKDSLFGKLEVRPEVYNINSKSRKW